MTDSFQNISVTSFPDITQIEFKSIHKRYLKVLLINVFLVFLVVFPMLFFVDKKGFFELSRNSIWIYLALFLVFIAVLSIKTIGFKKRKYAIREKDVSYKNGIFFRTEGTLIDIDNATAQTSGDHTIDINDISGASARFSVGKAF